MNNIVLIGAGQLGSRHLQGIARCNEETSIEVVEPYEQSRVLAKQRYEEVEENSKIQSINFFESIDALSNVIDVVVVATTSDVRSKVVKELLAKKRVKNLILEKVLFQTVEEYYEIEKLLVEKSVKCWVNHPRRMFPFYKELKRKIQNSEQVSYMVQGGGWGLGCNALHYIDHLSFLSGCNELIIDNHDLHPLIYETKRKNFVEFNGLLNGSLGKHLFQLYSHKEQIPGVVTIASDRLITHIDEVNGYVRIAEKCNNWKWEELNIKIVHFQSELTNLFVDEIMTTGNCSLPTFDEAMKLHIPFIQALLQHMKSIDGKEYITCPIT